MSVNKLKMLSILTAHYKYKLGKGVFTVFLLTFQEVEHSSINNSVKSEMALRRGPVSNNSKMAYRRCVAATDSRARQQQAAAARLRELRARRRQQQQQQA